MPTGWHGAVVQRFQAMQLLLVEDDQPLASGLQKALRAQGFTICCCRSLAKPSCRPWMKVI
jgi:hypothetical protein